jgi:hypothetical protein
MPSPTAGQPAIRSRRVCRSTTVPRTSSAEVRRDVGARGRAWASPCHGSWRAAALAGCVFRAAHRRTVQGRHGKKAGGPNVSAALPHARARWAERSRSTPHTHRGRRRWVRQGRTRGLDTPAQASSGAATRAAAHWYTCPAWSCADSKLVRHMALIVRPTCRPASILPISTRREHRAQLVLSTAARSRHSGPFRRKWAHAGRLLAAALTFGKSCP